ncbi:MAG TPA: hypothetical protein VHZ53_17790 [Steroidobacteraceae bacterium]|jgi:hypothetical protein|nr:hypothetical protein [Steroidobacteraceae bacterium]
MPVKPAIRTAIALVFAAMLMMQGFAVALPCAEHGPASSLPASAADLAATAAHGHCGHGGSGAHPTCGGACCLAALATAVARWTPPVPIAARIATPGLIVPLRVAPDRLDRPPRLSPA